MRIEELILEFLRHSYPISRIKSGRRFKRGVMIDGRGHIFETDSLIIKLKLFNILDKVYIYDHVKINKLLDSLYNFKDV